MEQPLHYDLLRDRATYQPPIPFGETMTNKKDNTMKYKTKEVTYRDVFPEQRDRKAEIEQVAENVAESVFHHFTDQTNKERLKAALIEFANVILNDDK